MDRNTLKTSTIFVATADRTRVYRSVEEVPADLREQLERSTRGMNAATILIADRNGRSELVRALRGSPSALQTRLAAREPQPRQRESRTRWTARETAALVASAVLGVSLWVLWLLR